MKFNKIMLIDGTAFFDVTENTDDETIPGFMKITESDGSIKYINRQYILLMIPEGASDFVVIV